MNINRNESRFWEPTSFIQLGYGLWTVLTTVGVGFAFGFSSVFIPQLKEAESTIQPTVNQESWIVSVLALACPAGCVLSGYLIDRIGRRNMLIACHVPMCIGWMVIGISSTVKWIIIGRMVVGFGCGMSTISPRIYLSEFTLPSMRGVIGVLPNLAMGLGITIEAILGSSLHWRSLCWFSFCYALLSFMLNMFLPESPYFLLLKDNIDGAKRSLKRFRSSRYNIESELMEMIEFKEDHNIRRLNIRQIVPAIFNAAACKPFAIINIYILFGQMSGVSIITFWSIEILMDTKTTVDPHVGNVVLGITRIIFGIMCSVLLYKTGRRPMSFISGFGAGTSFIMMGLYLKYSGAPSVVTMFCVISFMAFSALGYYSIPLMLIGEMFPLQVRGFLGGITVSLSFILIFASNKLYPFLKIAWGFANLVIILGSCSICGVIFLYFFLPETKDMTLSEIEEYFNGLLTTSMSQKQIMSLQLLSKNAKVAPRKMFK